MSSGGGDCTNFTSQSIYYGGFPMDTVGSDSQSNVWYYNFVGTDSFDSNYDDTWSVSWAVSNTNAYYLSRNYGSYIDTADFDNLKLGDLIYYDFDNDGYFDHTTIITSFDTDGTPRVTYRNAEGYDPAKDRRWDDISSQRVRAIQLVDSIL